MIYKKIKSRRTIRKYVQKDVPKEILSKCVTLSWAGYLPDYHPSKEEMPRAYIVILLDKDIRRDPSHDAGIAAMSISMVAYGEGLGSCILGAVDRRKLRKILNVPDNLDIVLVVALGYPAENPVVDRVKDGDIKYWLDQNDVLHVPKRGLKDIVRWNGYTR